MLPQSPHKNTLYVKNCKALVSLYKAVITGGITTVSPMGTSRAKQQQANSAAYQQQGCVHRKLTQQPQGGLASEGPALRCGKLSRHLKLWHHPRTVGVSLSLLRGWGGSRGQPSTGPLPSGKNHMKSPAPGFSLTQRHLLRLLEKQTSRWKISAHSLSVGLPFKKK